MRWLSSIRAIIILAVLVSLAFWGYTWWHGRKHDKDVVIGEKITQAQHVDSTHQAHLDSLSKKIDTVTKTTTRWLTRWDTVTAKVQLPGTVDSVYKDSAFAALPDSDKVKVLRIIGSQAAQSCRETILTCRQFRDSAYIALRGKDRLINLWHERYDNKPRRRCGPGVAGGYGMLSAPEGLRRGFGVVAGFACNL